NGRRRATAGAGSGSGSGPGGSAAGHHAQAARANSPSPRPTARISRIRGRAEVVGTWVIRQRRGMALGTRPTLHDSPDYDKHRAADILRCIQNQAANSAAGACSTTWRVGTRASRNVDGPQLNECPAVHGGYREDAQADQVTRLPLEQ